MQNKNKFPNRKSIRLKDYDYSEPGDYFITICAKNRENLFGKIVDGEMVFNEVGKTAEQCWLEIPKHFPNTELDIIQIMPNHIHFILRIIAVSDVGTENFLSLQGKINRFQAMIPRSLSSIVKGFKIGVTKLCNQNNLDFEWQPRFYDHIIRNEKSYDNIYNYIESNPPCWQEDLENLEFEKNLKTEEREKKIREFYGNLIK